MRKLSAVLVAALLLSAGALFAREPEKPTPEEQLSYRVWRLLKDNDIEVSDKDIEAKILFTLNAESEIIVLEVDTDNADLERFVKARLNYKKTGFIPVEKGKRYLVPLRITS